MTPGVPLTAARLAILTVTYQTGEEVAGLVDSLRTHPPELPWHLVLIDNASPDGSGPELATRYAAATDVTVRLLPENLGFGGANTLIAREMDAEYIAFINPDCNVLRDACTELVQYLATHPAIGVVGPYFFHPDGTAQSWPRTFPDPWSGLAGRRSFLRRVWPNNPLSRRYIQADRPIGEAQTCDWIVGTVMMVRREDFLRMGGFDPRFFLYWEDCDLCWEYRKQLDLGTAILSAGEIHHTTEAATTKVRPFATRHFNRAAYKLLCKHLFPFPLHPWRVFAYIMLSLRTYVTIARGQR